MVQIKITYYCTQHTLGVVHTMNDYYLENFETGSLKTHPTLGQTLGDSMMPKHGVETSNLN